MIYHHQRRLERTLYHLESLKAEMSTWLEGNPYRTWSETDADSTKKLLWVEVLDPPPAILSLIIGDCLHNLRSALENLALELAVAYKKGRLSKSIESDSGFPIFRFQGDEPLKKLNSMLRGIDPGAKAIIEGLQPYNRGQRFATNDPLWKLNQLSIEDRHRLPHVVLFVNRYLSLFALHGSGIDQIEPIFGPIEDRAPIARDPTVDETGAEVHVQLGTTFSVGFGQRAPKQLRGMPVPDTLESIHRHIVRKVIPPLSPFLPQIS